MVHPDEGTIRAWLDGTLAHDEASTIEAHVHGCEHCAAAVAEARGFIAASSRILSALDHVPGQVIPADVPAQPAVAHIRRADERKRRLRQTYAMAATLMLMLSGGLYVVNQTSRTPASVADTAALGERIAEAAREAADSAGTPAVAANVPAAAESQTGVSTPRAVTPGAKADVAATDAAVPPVPLPSSTVAARAGGTTGSATGNVAGAGAATQQLAQREARTQDSGRADQSQEQIRAAAARTANTSPVVASAPSTTAPAAPAPSAPAVPIVALTGCYQLNAQADLSIADSRRDEAMTVAALPTRIRLTDSLVSESAGERRYLARSVMTGGTPVRRFAWSVAPNGTMRLFVGDSASAPSVRVATDSGAATAARIRRVGCAN